jgi:hypothetical protein
MVFLTHGSPSHKLPQTVPKKGLEDNSPLRIGDSRGLPLVASPQLQTGLFPA